MSSFKSIFTLSLLLAADLVSGHAAIVNAVGDAGGSGMALGIDTSTPRDGTRRNPFQQDATRFKGDAADTVGETLAGGDNDVEAGTSAILAETGDELPQVTAGGEITMTLHQVNADGGGPYTCAINDDGTAQTWQNLQVTTTPPGEDSRFRDGAATDFPMVAAIPADQTCTGTVAGQDNVCLVRCQNDARAGPFGGVVPVQLADGATAGNATVARRKFARSMTRSKRARFGSHF
ncbi:putative mas3 protein [Phaeoacremonium minimum UCRPA7]|uniref:Putative mas3 protein n=1 Tax=Phaeoacremonium minimum (strain UCR-PA7) TaxID=1286976 RepID=R8BDR3_PHAM7|nr:putative mas3 protein [Phaeoacremonium minimum UCRPA7]EON97439.1 putative mas3 protein [Phaeoacremonium minimum UCRPA7]